MRLISGSIDGCNVSKVLLVYRRQHLPADCTRLSAKQLAKVIGRIGKPLDLLVLRADLQKIY